jgi:NAD(P)-dependent dehydrogenase (short-subunit alcohol dehydrogenase family)
MNDKVCLITGANRGLGKATAVALARLGAMVILACRDQDRGERARAEVISATGNPRVALMLVDLSLQESIRQMGSAFIQKYDHLDVLINNATIYTSQRRITPDGLETMFATNHIGPFLLTNLLLNKLKTSPSARVLVLTAPSTTPLDFDNLQGEKRFASLRAFGVTKMCNLLFTYELARRLEGTSITVNAVHPGLMKSHLMKEAPLALHWLTQLASSPPEKPASKLAHLALSPEMAGITGKFLTLGKAIESNQYSHDQSIQRRLWDISVALTGL